jgi:dipeptidyl aminopeptidase/acylaminoacyl peptidase
MKTEREVDDALSSAGAAWRNDAPELTSPYAVFRRHARGSSRGIFSPMSLASTALVLVVAVAVAGVFLNRPTDGLVGASATPTSVADLATPVTSPPQPSFPTEGPSPTANPQTARPIATPAAGLSWQRIGGADGVEPLWAPDGGHILLALETANATVDLVLVRSDGTEIARYSGYRDAVWLNNQEFIAYQSSGIPEVRNEFALVQAILGNASDGRTQEVTFPCCEPVGNGNGAVAVVRFLPEQQRDVARPRYAIWSDGGLSEEREGYPFAWSPGGEMLAVLHPSEATRGVEGWIEVISWPTRETIYADEAARQVGGLTFDPSGNYLAFPYASRDADGNDSLELNIVTLADGSVAAIPLAGLRLAYAWEAESNILVSDIDGGTFSRYRPDGSVVDQRNSDAPTIISSSDDGSTVFSYERDEFDIESGFEIDRNGRTMPLELPDGSFEEADVAPDGRHIIIELNAGGGYAAFIAAVPD